MPDRHGFLKYRHGFCSRVVVFMSETEIREWHNSGYRNPAGGPAGFLFRSDPEKPRKMPGIPPDRHGFLKNRHGFNVRGMNLRRG
jgi:hypothetical protein